MFDIIGLLLPGLIAISLIASLPLLIISDSELEKLYKNNIIFFSNITNFYNNNKTLLIVIVIIAAYILGHTIKVFSKYPYSFFEVIFDDGINKLIGFIFGLLTKAIKNIIKFVMKNIIKNNHVQETVSSGDDKFSIWAYLTKKPYRKKWSEKFLDIKKPWYIGLLNFIAGMYGFINYITKSIFSFKSPSYYKENKILIPDIMSKLRKKFNTNFPDDWYSIYKIAKVIMEQEKVKSLSSRFLAKYNFYRSLALIFLLNFVYIFYLYRKYNILIGYFGYYIYKVLLILNFLMWFTFHEKYKRYWTLCGNEALMSLFYFISKPERREEKLESEREEESEK